MDILVAAAAVAGVGLAAAATAKGRPVGRSRAGEITAPAPGDDPTRAVLRELRADAGEIPPHSNMHPFHRRPYLTQPMPLDFSDAATRTLDLYTGSARLRLLRRDDPRPVPQIALPERHLRHVNGMPVPAYVQDHERLAQVVSTKFNGTPFQQIQVGPGLGLRPDQLAMDGMHDTARPMPRDISGPRRNNLRGPDPVPNSQQPGAPAAYFGSWQEPQRLRAFTLGDRPFQNATTSGLTVGQDAPNLTIVPRLTNRADTQMAGVSYEVPGARGPAAQMSRGAVDTAPVDKTNVLPAPARELGAVSFAESTAYSAVPTRKDNQRGDPFASTNRDLGRVSYPGATDRRGADPAVPQTNRSTGVEVNPFVAPGGGQRTYTCCPRDPDRHGRLVVCQPRSALAAVYTPAPTIASANYAQIGTMRAVKELRQLGSGWFTDPAFAQPTSAMQARADPILPAIAEAAVRAA